VNIFVEFPYLLSQSPRPAIQEKNQVEAECQRVEMARQQAENAEALVKLVVEKNDRLRQKLREVGIDPDEIS
jgi:hypothetical protein